MTLSSRALLYLSHVLLRVPTSCRSSMNNTIGSRALPGTATIVRRAALCNRSPRSTGAVRPRPTVSANVPNGGLVPNLLADRVGEIPSIVTGRGLRAMQVPDLPPQLAAVLQKAHGANWIHDRGGDDR
jgi:hypothetical protein